MRNKSNEGNELKLESDIDNNIDTHIVSNIDINSSNELYINNYPYIFSLQYLLRKIKLNNY